VRRLRIDSVNSVKNILDSVEISVLFFIFEIKSSVFSKNIQIEEKPNTSPEAED